MLKLSLAILNQLIIFKNFLNLNDRSNNLKDLLELDGIGETQQTQLIVFFQIKQI